MAHEHSSLKFLQGFDHSEKGLGNQGLLNSYEDHTIFPTAVTSGQVNFEENTTDTIPMTAMVLGLASAVLFFLMVAYIVLKVHCFKKTKKSTMEVTHKNLENEADTTVASSRLSAIRTICEIATPKPYSVHSVEITHGKVNDPTLETCGSARLTGARYLAGQ